MYVSITGLELKRPRHLPRFFWHALRSMAQAQRAPGNLGAEARRIDGIHHTVTLWTDRAAMLAYLKSGAHLQAMRAFRAVTTGAVLGFEADSAPDWTEVPAIWRARGRPV